MFRGTFTALVTPFRDGEIDVPAFQKLIEAQIAGGITGVVAVGTTGESPTLSHDEREEVIRLAVTIADKRCQVLAGTGSNATHHAVADTKMAEKLGADGALVVAPYYNKPSQEGLFRHFQSNRENRLCRSCSTTFPDVVGRYRAGHSRYASPRECRNIVSIKEASGSVERVSELRGRLPDEFTILSGDDSLTLPFMSVGAAGVVSVASNLFPAEVCALVRAYRVGRCEFGAKITSAIVALVQRLVHRAESGTDENCARLARCDVE